MSGNYYSFVDYGMVIDYCTATEIASKLDSEFDPVNDNAYYALYCEGFVEYVADFSGNIHKVNNNGTIDFSKDINNGYSEIIYVSCDRIPMLFGASYNNIDEIVSEMKDKIGKYLPNDFNIIDHLCVINGVYYA